MLYGISITLAHYGPNAALFANIGSQLWGEPIENLIQLYYTMFFLFGIDSLSAVLNSLILWKVLNVNMLQEFGDIISKYWIFIVFKLSNNLQGYLATTDVNFGLDTSGNFEWITTEGRQNIIDNSTYLCL